MEKGGLGKDLKSLSFIFFTRSWSGAGEPFVKPVPGSLISQAMLYLPKLNELHHFTRELAPYISQPLIWNQLGDSKSAFSSS